MQQPAQEGAGALQIGVALESVLSVARVDRALLHPREGSHVDFALLKSTVAAMNDRLSSLTHRLGQAAAVTLLICIDLQDASETLDAIFTQADMYAVSHDGMHHPPLPPAEAMYAWLDSQCPPPSGASWSEVCSDVKELIATPSRATWRTIAEDVSNGGHEKWTKFTWAKLKMLSTIEAQVRESEEPNARARVNDAFFASGEMSGVACLQAQKMLPR